MPYNNKNTRDYQENLYKSARYNLLAVLAFTVINIVWILVGSGSYLFFSANIPYYLTAYGYVFDGYTPGTYTLTGLVMALPFLAAYLVCWLLSKKRSGWLVGALVLFSVDTAAMAGLVLLSGYGLVSWIVEIILHVWIVVSLARGVAAAAKLRNMPQIPQPPQYTTYVGTDPEELPEEEPADFEG